MAKLHFSSILALLLSILVNVNGTSDTIACENLDRKLDQVLQKQQELMEALLIHHPAASCKNVLELDPTASSGYYYIRSESGNSNYVYCDMTRTCGGDKGWMQLMKVDMTNRTHRCPQGLADYSYNRKHVCRCESSTGGCSSVNITAH